MKSLVRDRYNEVGEKRKRVREDEEAVELEVVTNNDSRRNQKVDLVKSRAKKRVKELDRRDIVSAEGWPKFKDLGGMDGVVEKLMRKVIGPMFNPHFRLELGFKQTTGILLHGPPGCGKTMLARAIANETGFPFYMISASKLVSGISGASEENIRELFSKAHRTAPSIIFIDEIDAIASKRENHHRGMETRIVAELMTCMDESHQLRKPDSESENSNARSEYVLVIAATNRPDALDPALRRWGRFDLEIGFGVPDLSARIQILSVLKQKFKLEGNFDLRKLARETSGFVGADLAELMNEAASIAYNRVCDLMRKDDGSENQAYEWLKQHVSPEEVAKSSITMADSEDALRIVQPSTRREGFSGIPDVKWDDIGGMHQLRQEFYDHIIRPIKSPERYEHFRVNLDPGFLLYGPPGCGKTSIAKAVAHEAGANFIHIQGPELMNKFVGESEKAVRTIFSRARTCSPCIIFFDEVDTFTCNRGTEGGDGVVQRLLGQLRIELDGGEKRKGVYVIGATNRPEVMDKTLLRPGRFGKLVYVPLPSAEERGLILKALARKNHVDAGVDLMAIGKDLCENFSGADLNQLMDGAARAAAADDNNPYWIRYEHFTRALEEGSPSVSKEDILHYNTLYRYATNHEVHCLGDFKYVAKKAPRSQNML